MRWLIACSVLGWLVGCGGDDGGAPDAASGGFYRATWQLTGGSCADTPNVEILAIGVEVQGSHSDIAACSSGGFTSALLPMGHHLLTASLLGPNDEWVKSAEHGQEVYFTEPFATVDLEPFVFVLP